MKKDREILREKVIRSFNEYKDYIELITEQNKDKREKVDSIKEEYEKDKESDKVMDFAFQIFMVDALHKRDIEILGSKFVNYMTLYKEIPDTEPLDEEIIEAFDSLKNSSKVQAFTVSKGKFEEINKDIIKEQEKIFKDEKVVTAVKEQLEKIL